MGKKKKQEVKDVVIDADHILYNVTLAKQYKTELGGELLGKIDLAPYKKHFKSIVDDYILTAEVESICYNWTIGKVRVILSDDRNFRYDLYSDYKCDRPPPPKLRRRLKKWAMKKYTFVKNTEADDVVAYYVRKGGIGFTTDKDLFKGVKGIWFNAHFMHRCWVRTTQEQGDRFFKQQILAGDLTDGIPSIDGIGLIKAKQLMDKYGWEYEDILSIFKDKTKVLGKIKREHAYSKKYMITMARLVSMSQWTPKKGIKLWTM